MNCDLELDIKMEYFSNPFGIKHNSRCCFINNIKNETNICEKNCLTVFRFCLKLSNHEMPCISEFESEIIGANLISKEQFELTTDSLKFPLYKQYLPVVLLVQAYNGAVNEDELIHKSSLELDENEVDISEWKQFRNKDTITDQELAFSYKLKCVRNCNLNEESSFNFEIKTNCNLNCKNGGVCVIENNEPVCRCDQTRFGGEFCQIRLLKVCDTSDSCFNGGSCLGNGECLCAPSYTGSRCEIKRLPSQCGQVTCYNGGTCLIDNRNEYVCLCHQAFTGEFCDIRVNLCEQFNQPCKNDAICEWDLTQSSYKCLCKEGYTGKNCSTVVPESISSSTTVQNVITVRKTLTQTEISFFLFPTQRQEIKKMSNPPSFTSQEIILIVLLGISMPIFAVMICLLVRRLRTIRKIEKNVEIRTISKNLNNMDKKKKSTRKENIYVDCKTEFETNIFNLENEKLNDKKVSVKLIEPDTKKVTINDEFDSNDIHLIENNIYSVFNYSQSNQYEEVNLKNSKLMTSSNEESYINNSSNIMASIV